MEKFKGVDKDKGIIYFNPEDVVGILLPDSRPSIISVILKNQYGSIHVHRDEIYRILPSLERKDAATD